MFPLIKSINLFCKSTQTHTDQSLRSKPIKKQISSHFLLPSCSEWNLLCFFKKFRQSYSIKSSPCSSLYCERHEVLMLTNASMVSNAVLARTSPQNFVCVVLANFLRDVVQSLRVTNLSIIFNIYFVALLCCCFH